MHAAQEEAFKWFYSEWIRSSLKELFQWWTNPPAEKTWKDTWGNAVRTYVIPIIVVRTFLLQVGHDSQKRHTRVEMIVTNATKWQVSMWAAKAHIKVPGVQLTWILAIRRDTQDIQWNLTTRADVSHVCNERMLQVGLQQMSPAVRRDTQEIQWKTNNEGIAFKIKLQFVATNGCNEKMLLACERLRHNTLCFNYCSSCLRGGRKLCLRIPSRESHVRRMSMAQCRLPALFAPWTFHDAKRADKPHSERTQPRTHGCRERMQQRTNESNWGGRTGFAFWWLDCNLSYCAHVSQCNTGTVDTASIWPVSSLSLYLTTCSLHVRQHWWHLVQQ